MKFTGSPCPTCDILRLPSISKTGSLILIDQIQWLGHGSFLLQGPPTIYINPWRVLRNHTFHADVLLIGHDHHEHFSLADINKLRQDNTRVITNERVATDVEDSSVLRPWQSITIDRTRITAVPAYSPNSTLHPIEDGGLGFVISQNFYDLYYAGDTGLIAEMERIRPDIAILPIDGSGTMTIDEAIEAVRIMRPRWVIPSNLNTQISSGSRMNLVRLRDEVQSIATVIVPQKA